VALRLAFLGTPDFAVPTLAELIGQGHDIACVYSQPPRPKGRGLGTEPSPVHALALAHKIPVRTPVTLRDAAQHELFAALELDAAVVVAYGLILPKPVLAAPKLGCFNLHGSLLPRWRGAAPIQRSIMAGDAETGVMSMRMEAGLDTGPVLMAERTPIGRKTYGDLHDELARLGAGLMARWPRWNAAPRPKRRSRTAALLTPRRSRRKRHASAGENPRARSIAIFAASHRSPAPGAN